MKTLKIVCFALAVVFVCVSVIFLPARIYPSKVLKTDKTTEPKKNTRFNGTWVFHDPFEKSYTIEINDDSTFFTTENTQQYVTCRNVYDSNMLLLYVVATDPTDSMQEVPFYHLQHIDGLLAVCYFEHDEFNIVYLQEPFNDDIENKLGFNGTWAVDSPFEETHLLEIKNDSTFFAVANNQLDIMCTNVYNHDTLLLYVASIDCNRRFQGPPFYYPPKIHSLFAKCYLQDYKLNIIYTQKQFRDNIADIELATEAYRNTDRHDRKYFILAP